MALADFTRGQVTMDGVALFMCDNFSFTHTNGGKLKSTLRKDPAGGVRGARSVSFSMNIWLPDDPADQDDLDLENDVRYKIPHILYLKLPGGRFRMIDGFFTEEGAEINVEDGVKVPVKGLGYFVSLAQPIG
jgi:hypothetical protein